MASFTLPKGKTTLLVMDCQNDVIHEEGKGARLLAGGGVARIVKERNLLANIARVIAAMRAAHVPVIHVRHAYRHDYADAPENAMGQNLRQQQIFQDGTWGAEIHSGIDVQPEDFIVTKTRVSAFYASALEAILTAKGLTHLVMTGFWTDGVVEGTAREGADRGYTIFIPEDCCATADEETHRRVLGGLLGTLAHVCRSGDVIQAVA